MAQNTEVLLDKGQQEPLHSEEEGSGRSVTQEALWWGRTWTGGDGARASQEEAQREQMFRDWESQIRRAAGRNET